MYQGTEICLQIDGGIVLHGFQMEQPMPARTTMYYRKKPEYSISSAMPNAVLEFIVTTRTPRHMTLINQVLRFNPGRLTCLGPGLICAHCGSKNPSGVLKCVFCGGSIQEQDWISPVQLRGRATICSTIASVPAIDEYEPRHTEWSISLDQNMDIDGFVQALASQSTAMILPVGNVLDESFYLCHHCGGITQIGDTCSGCGGEQIPLAEVVKMDRDCLYCGTKTVSGIICPNCGRRLSGESYKQWMRGSTQ